MESGNKEVKLGRQKEAYQLDFFEISMLLKKKRQIDKKGARKQSNPCLHTTLDPFMTLQVKKSYIKDSTSHSYLMN